ncbi:InlB B-repeat-containing protein [Aeromicrobium ginsengisoli]|uniref:Bacterial repeat domain-containing protein n=1 Tax=Aeromicrobium ginsengisoli TaxID=363867 RepID=A0A5M4FBW6_9ACTN|nr:InlB B-repeat-containing protein [Aeromicrobium ginsengisoli]KAA1395795.1 hypothetical protein ESP70_016790 [Aeromicrobium ginsengisoli]
MSHRRQFLTLLASTTLAGGLLVVAGSPASAASVDTFAELATALSTCSGTPAAPTVVTLAADISQPEGELTIGCAATLNLGVHDLAVARIVITTGKQLTIDAASPASELTVITPTYLRAAIGTTGATLIVNQGTVTAENEGGGAAIGGDYERAAGTITINDGVVKATSGSHGAAIGSGEGGVGASTITINGGTVTATSDHGAAAIGGGYASAGSTITINGGTIDAVGGSAGIGDGVYLSSAGTVTINGGTVTAEASNFGGMGNIEGVGIGGMNSGVAGGVVTINGGTITARGGTSGIGYVSPDGGVIAINAGDVTTTALGGPALGTLDYGDPRGATGTISIGKDALVTVPNAWDRVVVGGTYGGVHGSLLVDGTLRLPDAEVLVPAYEDGAKTPNLTVGPTGRILGAVDDPSFGGNISGDGWIQNDGTIALSHVQTRVGNSGVAISHHHYAVSFDSRGGSPAPAPVIVFADSFTRGARTFPAAPTKAGSVFAGWNTHADGSGTTVTADTILPGSSNGLAAVPIALHAQWITHEITGLNPQITGTAREGKTLTAQTGSVAPHDAHFSYRWYEDGHPIPGATDKTLRLGGFQAARRISVRITASVPDGPTVSKISAKTSYVSSAHKHLVISDHTINHRATFHVAATGLKPGQRAKIWLGGKLAYTGRADSTGTVHRTVRFPTSVEPGHRRVRVSGYSSSGDRTYTIFTVVTYR